MPDTANVRVVPPPNPARVAVPADSARWRWDQSEGLVKLWIGGEVDVAADRRTAAAWLAEIQAALREAARGDPPPPAPPTRPAPPEKVAGRKSSKHSY